MTLLAAAMLLLALPASSGTIEVSELKPRSRLEEIRLMLDYAIWNPRVSAVYDLGDLGPDALPLLVYAVDDADWQVRLTAVHFLGKAGPGAVEPLFDVARFEPCPHVRLLALRGLSKLGREGAALYREVLTPEDEEQLARMPKTKVMGRTVVIDAPQGDMTKEFFDGVMVDPRVCASSERAGRLRKHLKWPRGKERKDWSKEIVVTPEVTVGRDLRREAFEREEREYAEKERRMTAKERGDKRALDELFASNEKTNGINTKTEKTEKTEKTARNDERIESNGKRIKGMAEVMPKHGPGFGDRVVENGAADYLAAARPELRRKNIEEPLKRNDATAETMPLGPPGIEHELAANGAADVNDDKGTGKIPYDPLQDLMRRLKSPEARVRARAADELGKRGRSASAAAPALRKALKDKDRRVRASAALALGSAGTGLSGVETDLERARRDKDEDVRFSASVALRRLRAE